MKRKPAPKPARPAYTITEALSEKERESARLSKWLLRTEDGREAHIIHPHDAKERDQHTGGAWYFVNTGSHASLDAYVFDIDFTAAIRRALRLIGGAK